MDQQMVRIGNSAGVVIPKSLRRELGLRPGSRVHVDKWGSKIVVMPVAKRSRRTVSPRFVKIVDEFMREHEDVLKELAKR